MDIQYWCVVDLHVCVDIAYSCMQGFVCLNETDGGGVRGREMLESKWIITDVGNVHISQPYYY